MNKHECDESCRSCPQCYVKTGETLCEQECHCERPNLIFMSSPVGNEYQWIKDRFINSGPTWHESTADVSHLKSDMKELINEQTKKV